MKSVFQDENIQTAPKMLLLTTDGMVEVEIT